MASPSPILSQAFTEVFDDLKHQNVPQGTRWADVARASQLPPPGTWRIWGLVTGRGWGKTRVQAEFAHQKAKAIPGSAGFIAARTLKDAKKAIIGNPRSGILATQHPNNRCEFRSQDGVIKWANGSIAHIHTSEEPDSARGPEYEWGVADEIGTWKRVVDFEGNTLWDNLQFGLSAGRNPQMVAGTTPRRGNRAVKRPRVGPHRGTAIGRIDLSSHEPVSSGFCLSRESRFHFERVATKRRYTVEIPLWRDGEDLAHPDGAHLSAKAPNDR